MSVPHTNPSGSASPSKKNLRALAIAVALVVAVAVVAGGLTLEGAFPFSQTRTGANPPPLDTVLDLGSFTDGYGDDSQIPDCAPAPCNFFNTTYSLISAKLTYGELLFGVTSSVGVPVSVTGGIAVEDTWTGLVIGYYDFQNGSWFPTSMISTTLESYQELTLFERGGPPLPGDRLSVTGPSEYSGRVEDSIT
ncbi:MAG: hypothetical protein WCB18_05185 [Thermoplasmata archaeon]